MRRPAGPGIGATARDYISKESAMGEIQYRSVEEIAEVLRDVKFRGRSCSLLIGAGASIGAGIPIAADFVEIIKRRFGLAYDRASEKTYPKCMAELLLSQRRNLIAEYVDKAKINWAHVGIALLMQAGYIDRVLTTNFDLLVVKACAMLGVFPAVYDFATSQLLKTADIPDLAVFYLHGQRTGFVLMNTIEDMESHSALLGPVFSGAGSGRTWIVVGYSGANDPVFEHLASQQRFDNGLFWIGHGDREPPAHVRERLLACNKDAYFTKGLDADSFFVSLTQGLKVFPPDVVARPFTYVRQTLERLSPFVQPGQMNQEDVLHKPNKWIQSAIEQFEVPAWNIITRVETSEDGETDREVMLNAAQYLSMKGDYEHVIELRSQYAAAPTPELADLISHAYVMQGNRLLDSAKHSTVDEAERLFVTARSLYEKALEIKPDRHEAIHNWANFLLDLAKASRSDESACRFFDEAESKYAVAFAMKPDQPEILINWGNLLLDRAKAGSRENATRWFAEAEKKYWAALEIKPNMPSVRYSLGNLLLDQAKMLSGREAELLFTRAEAQYKLALESDPSMAEAHYQCGNIHLDRAKVPLGVNQDSEFQAGIEKYRKALEIRPDMHQALNNWGSLLTDLGKTKEDGEADQLFEQAKDKYLQSTLKKPNFYETWNNWGNLLLEWRKRKRGSQAGLLFSEAQDKYRRAHELRPDVPEVLVDWGNLLLDHARTLRGIEAANLLEAAIDKYASAIKIRPNMSRALEGMSLVEKENRSMSGNQAAVERARTALASGNALDGQGIPAGDIP